MAPRIFDDDLKRELQDAWIRHDAPLARGGLVPPLPRATLDRLCREAGVTLTPEALAWWSWHNGTEFVFGRSNPGLLDDQFHLTDLQHALGHEVLDPQSQPMPAMVAVSSEIGTWYLDCRNSEAVATPVYNDDPHGLRPMGPLLVAESLGDLVSVWIERMDRGVWARDSSGRFARIDHLVTERDVRSEIY